MVGRFSATRHFNRLMFHSAGVPGSILVRPTVTQQSNDNLVSTVTEASDHCGSVVAFSPLARILGECSTIDSPHALFSPRQWRFARAD